jgi:hypothetical protein
MMSSLKCKHARLGKASYRDHEQSTENSPRTLCETTRVIPLPGGPTMLSFKGPMLFNRLSITGSTSPKVDHLSPAICLPSLSLFLGGGGIFVVCGYTPDDSSKVGATRCDGWYACAVQAYPCNDTAPATRLQCCHRRIYIDRSSRCFRDRSILHSARPALRRRAQLPIR